MCCCFCKSFRGAAYFGTTAQIIFGLAVVIKYGIQLPDVKLSDLQDLVSGAVAVLFSYGLLIFIFGCCIFRGIENESLRLLKVCVGGLTFLQCLVLLTHLTLIALAFDELKEEERMTQVSILALNLIMTFVQLTTLFLYMIRLAKRELTLIRASSDTSESSLPLSSSSAGGVLGGGGGGGGGYKTPMKVGGQFGGGKELTFDTGRYSVGSSTLTNSSMGQRYVDGQWEDLHV